MLNPIRDSSLLFVLRILKLKPNFVMSFNFKFLDKLQSLFSLWMNLSNIQKRIIKKIIEI